MKDDEKVNRDFLFMGVQPERLDRERIYDGTEPESAHVLCVGCGCDSTDHAVDDEERRECNVCACRQFRGPK